MTGRGRIINAHKLHDLHPAFRTAVNQFLALAQDAGLTVTVTSGFRSIEDQRRVCAELKERERREGRKYPCATPGLSAHQYGLAVDMMGGDGFSGGQHAELVRLGVELGFGRVANDPPHFEHPAWRALYPYIKAAIGA